MGSGRDRGWGDRPHITVTAELDRAIVRPRQRCVRHPLGCFAIVRLFALLQSRVADWLLAIALLRFLICFFPTGDLTPLDLRNKDALIGVGAAARPGESADDCRSAGAEWPLLVTIKGDRSSTDKPHDAL